MDAYHAASNRYNDQPSTIILDFDQDDMKFCHLVRRDTGETLYKIQSSAKLAVTSFFRVGEDLPFAALERHDMLPDKITFKEAGSTMRIGKWLKTLALSSWYVSTSRGEFVDSTPPQGL